MAEPQRCVICKGETSEDDPCSWCDNTGFEVDGTDNPICPYCGKEGNDDDYVIVSANDSEVEFDCYECGRSYMVRSNTSVTYTSWRKDGNQP